MIAEEEMIQVEEREQIRRAYFVEAKSIRQIAKELGHSRPTVRQAIEAAEPSAYTLTMPRVAPVLGPYKAAIDRLLEENKHLPRKQRYTSHKMYEAIHAQGYAGSEQQCAATWVSSAVSRNVQSTCRPSSVRARMPKPTGAKVR